MKKGVVSCILLFSLLLTVFSGVMPQASAAWSYDPYKAIAYAEENYDNGVGLCAEFVWNCVKAGGMPLSTSGMKYSYRVTAGVAEGVCKAMGIPFTSVGAFPILSTTSFYGPNTVIENDPLNAALSIGDLIFTYCDTCGKTPHVEIWGGDHTYSHNPARPGTFQDIGAVGPGHEGHSISLRYLSLSDMPMKECACEDYYDVSVSEWYHADVDQILSYELMNGVSDHDFDPEGTMTRAMLVTVLWRYNIEPPAKNADFTDVKSGQWFTSAIAWAAQEGIVGGIGNHRFDPNGNVTREQLATILYRYTNHTGNDTSAQSDLSSFPDCDRISDWALESMQWAVAVGLINGSNGKLMPQGNATRTQVAAILNRYINRYGVVPAKGVLGENHTWQITSDGTLIISGAGDMPELGAWNYDTQIYEGAPWYRHRAYIRRLVIEEGTTRVPNFNDYDALEEVTLPDSLKKIGTFSYCDRLRSLTVPPQVTEIYLSIVYSCEACESLYIPASVETIITGDYLYGYCCPIYVDENNPNYLSDEFGVLYNKDKTKLLMAHNDLAGTYIVPEGVTAIGNYSFMTCDKLEKIELPDTVCNIGNSVFAYCTKLRNIRMPAQIDTIGQSVFEQCTRLESVKLPEGCTAVYDIFRFCISLQKVELPDSITALYGAFQNCRSLTALIIPKNVRSINSAFNECHNLTDLYFLGNAPDLPSGSCYYDIPEGITIHYIVGTSGWDNSVWSSYTLKSWTP